MLLFSCLQINDRIYEIKKQLEAAGIRVEVDDRSEKIGFKIRSAQLEKVPYMLIVGDKDVENNTVSVRSRKDGEKGAMSVESFIMDLVEEIETKALWYMNDFPKRKPNRLKGYDYSSNGVYFITICTDNRKCILSEIVGADTIRPYDNRAI